MASEFPGKPNGPVHEPHESVVEPQGGRMVIVGIVVIAFILAIAFFYVAGARDRHDQSETVMRAAESVEVAARNVGDAARSAAERMRKGD